jgi:hypothetical protein
VPTLTTHNCHVVDAIVARGYLKHPQIYLPVFVIKSDNLTRPVPLTRHRRGHVRFLVFAQTYERVQVFRVATAICEGVVTHFDAVEVILSVNRR